MLSDSKEKLVIEKGKIESVINSFIDGLIMIDTNQKIALINPEAKIILGIEDSIGKTFLELINFPKIKELYEVLAKTDDHCKEKMRISF